MGEIAFTDDMQKKVGWALLIAGAGLGLYAGYNHFFKKKSGSLSGVGKKRKRRQEQKEQKIVSKYLR